MDAAYSEATRIAYEGGDTVRDYNLRQLVRYLVNHQFDYLNRAGPAKVRNQLAHPGERRERLADRIAAGFAEESAQGLERSRKVLKDLADDFKLGVVSNFYGNLDVILAEAGIRELIQVAIDSKRLGIFKPDQRIFVAALKVLDLPHREVAMVGDSLDKDCAPARKLGMRTIWLRGDHDGHQEHRQAGAVAEVADHTIEALDELKELRW